MYVPDHINVVLHSCINNPSEAELTKVCDFLRQYQSVFATSKDDLGETDCVLHIINTGQARFIKQAPRRIPIYQKEEVSEELKRMLDVGVIKPSKSPWASPIVIVRKSDGSISICVDDRKVNEVTIKDSYPLPRINDSLDVLHKSSWFYVLDLQSGFWEVKMDPADQEETAFVTNSGLYKFTKMPFSLCNSPATFERLMESVLAGLQW